MKLRDFKDIEILTEYAGIYGEDDSKGRIVCYTDKLEKLWNAPEIQKYLDREVEKLTIGDESFAIYIEGTIDETIDIGLSSKEVIIR